MDKGLPHLALAYDDRIPVELVSGFSSIAADERLAIRIESYPSRGPQAGLEWLLPSLVIVFIAKAYFDAFLKEAGKDHYHVLKSAVGRLWTALAKAGIRAVPVTAGGKTVDETYSLVLSVIAEAKDGRRFKLLIQNSTQSEQLEAAIVLFLKFLEAYHAAQLDEEMTRALADARVVGGTILLAFETERQRLRPVDPIAERAKG